VRALAVRVRWVGNRQPKRPWLAQIESGKTTETLPGDHATEKLALAAATREIGRRSVAEAR
jgi:hypothetical protein